MDEESPPSVHVRWFQIEVSELLSTVPLVLNSSPTWRPLTREESDACEAAWIKHRSKKKEARQLSSNAKVSKSENEAVDDGAETTRSVSPLPVPPEQIEESDDDDFMGVPIEREKLFEVDVRTMRVQPIYWQASGPAIKVKRSVWMYNETKPLDEDLSTAIEEAYMHVKPWQSSYADELATSRTFGVEAQSKLAYTLSLSSPAHSDLSIIFEEGGKGARLISTKSLVSQRLSSFLTFGLSSTRANPYEAGSPGVTLIYRGWDEAHARSHPSEEPSSTLPQGDGVNAPGPSIPQRNTIDIPPLSPIARALRTPTLMTPLDEVPIMTPQPHAEEYTDLILIVHGIGQGLTAQYDSWNFVYAINYFRNVARKQANTPALASIMRSRHVQFLPIAWRTSMKFDLDAEAQSQGHQNHFTLSEVTPKGTIPFIREMTNSVLTDIPLFMSHHKSRMIESVCEQANHAYRLWCARNPGFEKRGRVHILAHSLGSALVADILSNQPTHVPPLSTLSTDPEEKRIANKSGFLFDTHLLFNVGSPLSIFLRIQEAQLIARKGRERTAQSPPDEALDRVGLFGCLSVDSIFNIFNPSDPIAYLLNPTVDSIRAKAMQPTQVPNVQAPILAPIRSSFGKFFLSLSPSSSSKKKTSTTASRRKSHSRTQVLNTSAAAQLMGTDGGEEDGDEGGGMGQPMLSRSVTGDGLELFDNGKDLGALEGTKAERRFLALNPRGTLDYILPSEGNFSEYVDMLTAHSAYWSDPSLASFLLAEIFATKVDMLRTNVGFSTGY